MARVTVEDCLEHVANRFALVHLAVHRARQLQKGSKPLVDRQGSRKEKEGVVALREIGAGKVKAVERPMLRDFEAPPPPPEG